MRIRDLFEQWFLAAADQIVARQRRPAPPRQRLAAARIVAHRGAYDNREVVENTMAAFEAFERVGGWGIELDIRWTRDGEPVVSHDPDGRRLFGLAQPIAALDGATLRRRLPQVPALADVVARFGGRLHLMVEIKSLFQDDPLQTRRRLQGHLEGLVPGRDFHLLSLDTRLLERLAFQPSPACLPIARINTRQALRSARSRGWGGLTGHYSMVCRAHIEDLHRRGLQVGTGFVNSASCLYREIERGVDWFFSDRALALQRWVPARQEDSSTR